MKIKNLKIPAIIIASGLILAVLAYMLTGMLKIPTITEHDFNYSAEYTINGETKTLEGVYRCCFKSVGEGIDPLDRYYEGYYPSDPTASKPKSHTIATKDDLELRIVFIFTNDYLMGDGERDEEYNHAIPEPYLAVYDKEGYEYCDSDILGKFDVTLNSWKTPEPIKNTFVFKGFSILHAGSMLVMLLAGILTVIACVVFVKKDNTVTYISLDNASMALNFIVGFVAIPFMTLVVFLMGIYVSGEELVYQIDLCVPAITAFTIAISLALRRKGFAQSGFLVQFIGPALFVLLMLLESII